MALIERARAVGMCPPSLLKDYGNGEEYGKFEAAVNRVLDASGFFISSDPSAAKEFQSLLQLAESIESIPQSYGDSRRDVLAQRRCIILALVRATPADNPSSAKILSAGFLSSVKLWLDDILNESVGGIDLLLHLLSSITHVPVTKSVVKDSGMGKAVGSIEKHRICAGTPNEASIKERVSVLKSAWNKSVKALKEKSAATSSSTTTPASAAPAAAATSRPEPSLKRASDNVSAQAAKKAKTQETKKVSTLSSLLGRVKPGSSSSLPDSKPAAKKEKKQSNKRVKWGDHFGSGLTSVRILEGDGEPVDVAPEESNDVSWSDRKKRDRLREKELLSKVRRAKLDDDDDDDNLGMMPSPRSTIQPTMAWKEPLELLPPPDAPPTEPQSVEIAAQVARMAMTQPTRYASDSDVPNNPAPLTDVEQALDMTSQSSATLAAIPFFVPAPTPAPVAAAPAPAYSQYAPPQTNLGVPSQSTGASLELVQSLGLPLFLVGQNVQALQTLASTPSLLSTFVDANGMYDQPRLMNLVQTLTQTSGQQNTAPAPSQPYAPAPTTQYAQPSFGTSASSGGIYGPASGSTYPTASTTKPLSGGNGYRGDQNHNDANLHLSGYGPTTTQAEIIALFAPYVKVDEVVMKANFSFVNTSDPLGAQRAREALQGSLVGGMPVRINMATRKARDPNRGSSNFNAPSSYGNAGQSGALGASSENQFAQSANNGFGATPSFQPYSMGHAATTSTFPSAPAPAAMPPMQTDYDNVRDDRGNPATKNLFVAGYGPGTTEQQLRDLFGMHATVVGVVMKGNFSFVNTSDKGAAVVAREALKGTPYNGGTLRINFAKETGRLGTSFDITYNATSRPAALGGPQGATMGAGAPSYYGRGF